MKKKSFLQIKILHWSQNEIIINKINKGSPSELKHERFRFRVSKMPRRHCRRKRNGRRRKEYLNKYEIPLHRKINPLPSFRNLSWSFYMVLNDFSSTNFFAYISFFSPYTLFRVGGNAFASPYQVKFSYVDYFAIINKQISFPFFYNQILKSILDSI